MTTTPMNLEVVTTVPKFPMDGSIPTLGWDAVTWMEYYLLQPDGPDAGESFRLTTEQINFLLWFYALEPNGKFKHLSAVLRRSKGWGKSPFLGAIALLELCGPCRFGGWDKDGEPIAVPHPMPWVVLAGVSEEQNDNTMLAIQAMSEQSALVDELGLDVGITRVLLPTGGKLVGITSNARSKEGGRWTFAIADETHHWNTGDGGKALADVIDRNVTKSRDGSARLIETTNAHEPGRDSVAEGSYLAWRAQVEGRTRGGVDILYDSRELNRSVDLANEEELTEALKLVYGDSTWLDLNRIKAAIYNPRLSPENARRFYLNELVAAADSWVTPAEWSQNRNDEIAPLNFAKPGDWKHGDTVTLGFDGSLTDDSTALVACRISDKAPFLLAVWEKPEGPAGVGWEVPKDQVRDAVDNAFATLDVVAFFSDVAYWETDVDTWREKYAERLAVKATTKHAVGLDMRGNRADVTRSSEALNRAITDGELPWRSHTLLAGTNRNGEAHEVLTRHVLNARRRPNQFGVTFGKESRESPKKVDALASLLLAYIALQRVLSDNNYNRRSKASKVWVF